MKLKCGKCQLFTVVISFYTAPYLRSFEFSLRSKETLEEMQPSVTFAAENRFLLGCSFAHPGWNWFTTFLLSIIYCNFTCSKYLYISIYICIYRYIPTILGCYLYPIIIDWGMLLVNIYISIIITAVINVRYKICTGTDCSMNRLNLFGIFIRPSL